MRGDIKVSSRRASDAGCSDPVRCFECGKPLEIPLFWRGLWVCPLCLQGLIDEELEEIRKAEAEEEAPCES